MMNFFGKTDKKDYVICVVLRHGDGQGFLLETFESSRKVRVVDQRAFTYTNGWDNLTYDIDELLFNIENDNKITVKKAVFFVYSHLVDLTTREIASPYKEILEKIVVDNELDILGYLEMDQVVSRYFTEKEGATLSATMIEVDTPAVSLFIYQAGELMFSESVARTENIITDLTDLFGRTQKGITLPSRIIMYDSTSVEEESSKVIAHKWPKDIFMHVPKVDIVTEMDVTNAILQSAPEFAFEEPPQHSEPEAQVQTTLAMQSTIPEDLGFVVGADVIQRHMPEPAGTDVYDSPMQSSPRSAIISPLVRVQNIMEKFQSVLSNASGKKPLFIGIAIVVILVASVVAGLYYAHSATLTLYYDSIELSDNLDFDNADFIEKKTEVIETEASVATTGTKEIGEKATGEVTIFNATESDKTFKKGTKLIASGSRSFILDSDVTVKAAEKTVTSSGDILTTTSKEKANITAEDIGTDYNLAKDTKFYF
ncbi:MAG: hypothetical protein UZ22_OP11002000297 [Microgenomates bacterium OLB23]|nr:MAG: hypothetical protein UZ22_OP11002000297 [Microgenomates bacterium OLB23]